MINLLISLFVLALIRRSRMDKKRIKREFGAEKLNLVYRDLKKTKSSLVLRSLFVLGALPPVIRNFVFLFLRLTSFSVLKAEKDL